MLKAYMTHDGCPEENAALVYAHNNQQARKVANGYNNIGAEGYFSIRADRLPKADIYVSKDQDIEHPYIESKTAILRLAGWICEGDNECVNCGLAEMDNEFPVCSECGNCAECGHLENCPEKTTGTENQPSLTP